PVDNNGTDRFQASLKNDWVFTEMAFLGRGCDNFTGDPLNLCETTTFPDSAPTPVTQQSKADVPTDFDVFSTSTNFTVGWKTVRNDGLAFYAIEFRMEGPAGVPYK